MTTTYTAWQHNLPNGHKYTKQPYNTTRLQFPFQVHQTIYPNLNVWYESIPTGNLAKHLLSCEGNTMFQTYIVIKDGAILKPHCNNAA
jgi:hypothetical protein